MSVPIFMQPVENPRKRTRLQQLIEQEQADIEAERRRQEFAEAQGVILRGLGQLNEPRKP